MFLRMRIHAERYPCYTGRWGRMLGWMRIIVLLDPCISVCLYYCITFHRQIVYWYHLVSTQTSLPFLVRYANKTCHVPLSGPLCTIVSDPWRFDMDPDPGIRSTGFRTLIRILLFTSVTFKIVPIVVNLESHWRIEQDSEPDPYPN
jgi:hypothetical protein